MQKLEKNKFQKFVNKNTNEKYIKRHRFNVIRSTNIRQKMRNPS